MWLALTGAIPALGFIAAGPAGPLLDDPDAQAQLIFSAQELGLRGYIIVGEEDEIIPNAGIELFVDMLNEAGIPCDLETVPHAGHDYVPEFEDAILRALAYVTQEV
jgi:predicted esterase